LNPHPPDLESGALAVRATGLPYFPMNSMAPTIWAIFPQFKPIRRILFVLRRRVIPPFTFRTSKCNYNPHLSHPQSITSVTTPAPTVFPPSRIANLKPGSKATGSKSSTSKFTLSPGITISTPSGNFTVPVTSVVLK